MCDDNCSAPECRSFLTRLAGATAATALTAVGAGGVKAATLDVYADPPNPALSKGNMVLDATRAALVVIDPRQQIAVWRSVVIGVSLALLAIPTPLLAIAPDLATFAALRVLQGVFMAAAFTLTMAYLAEHCSAEDTTSALAAYVTGVVASNLVGCLVSASVADMFGLAPAPSHNA